LLGIVILVNASPELERHAAPVTANSICYDCDTSFRDARRLSRGDMYKAMTGKQRYMLFILALVYACHLVDRTIVLVLLDSIKAEYRLSDTQLGLFSGFAFAFGTLVAAMPLGALADRKTRKSLLAGCIALWSVMTLLCGMAANYTSLLLLRFGVGAAEAGLQPTALSMVADGVPKAHRAKAVSLVHMGIALGTLIGFISGGWIATHLGWRAALLVVGLPGLVLAAIVWRTLDEPARVTAGGGEPDASVSLVTFFKLLWQDKALLHVVAGVTVLWLCVSSASAWWASFFLRSFNVPLTTVGAIMAGTAGIGGMTGNYLSSLLAGKFARGRLDRLALIAVSGALIYFPLSMITLQGRELGLVVTTLFLQMTAYFLVFSPAYSIAMSVAQSQTRGRTAAIMSMGATVIGYGVGPQIVGILSDELQPTAGKESLRYAMMIAMLIILWCAAHFIVAYRHLRARAAAPTS